MFEDGFRGNLEYRRLSRGVKQEGGWVFLVFSSALSPFSQVCELDIIFNFEKAYFILDEFLMGGDVQDTSKKSVLKAIEQADLLQEVRARDSEEEEEEDYCVRGDSPPLAHPARRRQVGPPPCGVWPPSRPAV